MKRARSNVDESRYDSAGDRVRGLTESERREILADLRQRGFRPDRRRGQNFLFDRQLLDAFIDDAQLPARSRIVEIGAGAGTLTRRLLERGHRVVSVEIESVLVDYLRESLRPARIVGRDSVIEEPEGNADFSLVVGDALANKNQLSSSLTQELQQDSAAIHLIANLPYAIASPVVQLLLELRNPQLEIVGVLVQSEAAERWCASPGGKDYGAISVTLSLLGRGVIARRVGRQLFSPPPKVESAFYVWRRFANAEYADGIGRAHRLGRRLFRQRRKMLRAIIGKGSQGPPDWASAGIDPTLRPEQLAPPQFVRLAEILTQEDWTRLGLD